MPRRYNRRRPGVMSRRRRPIRYTKRRNLGGRGYRMKPYKAVMSFKRSAQLTSISTTASVQNLVYNFSLNALPNAAEFINLYDAYKIKCVVLKFIPMFTGNDMNAQSTAYAVPPIHSVIDTSDSTPLSLVSDYLQYSSYKMTRGLSIHTRKIYPKYLDTIDDNGTAVAGAIKGGWIRTEGSGPDVDHLGLKVCIPNTGASSSTNVYQVFATYYIQCKNTK